MRELPKLCEDRGRRAKPRAGFFRIQAQLHPMSHSDRLLECSQKTLGKLREAGLVVFHSPKEFGHSQAAVCDRILYFRRPVPNERFSEIARSEEHTSELQSLRHLVCRLLLEKK